MFIFRQHQYQYDPMKDRQGEKAQRDLPAGDTILTIPIDNNVVTSVGLCRNHTA